MVRAPYFDENGTKKGAWSEEEDHKLKAYIERYGHRNWRELPKLAGLSRCGKSCRLRWLNYLRPSVKRGNYTTEEEDLIIDLHKSLGGKWAMIAAKLPGRSDNEIKNHWHTNLRKRAKHISSNLQNETGQNLDSNEEKGDIMVTQIKEKDEANILLAIAASKSSYDLNIKQSSTYSCDSYDSLVLSKDHGSFVDFWTTPFLTDTFNSTSDSYPISCYNHDMTMDDDFLWSVM